MNPKALSNNVLHIETLAAAAREKSATLSLLEFLAEVDSRRLYNARGYSSLWEYVHVALGYSEASASERVSAMKLMQKVPEVKTELENNRLTLTAASKLASFVKRERCSPEKATELLMAVTDKSTREVERVLAAHQTVPVTKPDVVRPSGPETTRIAFDADPEFMALYEEMKNLQGQPGWGMNERLKEAMRELIERKKKLGSKKPAVRAPEASGSAPVRAPEASGSAPVRAPEASGSTSVRMPEALESTLVPTPEVGEPTSVRAPEEKKPSRYIPVRSKQETTQRSGRQCEFVDPSTKRRCASRFGLQFDHIYPFAKGGSAEPGNIRHLCASHNRYEAVREFGAEKIPGVRIRKTEP